MAAACGVVLLSLAVGCGPQVVGPGSSLSMPPAATGTLPSASPDLAGRTSADSFSEVPTVPAASVLNLPAPSSGRSHQVRAGETLSSIARQHGTTLQRLLDRNGLDPAVPIQPGQILQLP